MDFDSIIGQFNFVVVFQGFFLSVALFFLKKGEKKLNILLGIMLLVFSWSGFYYNIDAMGKMGQYLSIAYTNSASDYIYNPLIYLYVLALTGKLSSFKRKYLLHFIPAAFMILYYANYFFAPLSLKTEIFAKGYNYFPWDVLVFAYANLVQLLVYLILRAIILNRYGKTLSNLYSNTARRNHNWLKFILILNAFAAVICFFMYGTKLDFVHKLISLAAALLVYAIGYKMMSAPPHLPEAAEITDKNTEVETSSNNSDAPKYERSGLTDQKAKQLAEKLSTYMQSAKPYLEPELNLKQLATQLNIPPHQLSQIINQQFGKNFYDYINSFRVQEVEKMIRGEQNNHLTLLAIAFDCGFNSKASFNNVFKKIKGKSPSEFRKELSVQEIEGAQIV